jgi:mannose-1-phosphate guanylyltransferase/mannose-6-phosphate isomerase
MTNITPVILSGGSGSRLWPLSRAFRPKQFLGVTEELSLFQLTLSRLQSNSTELKIESPVIVANDDHRFLVAQQCLDIHVVPKSLILEPIGRNTAPAIAVAAFSLLQEDPILLVLPSDHIFTNNQAFLDAVQVGANAAELDGLVTFGIIPTAPETGYGYVKSSVPLDATKAVAVEKFVEKPDLETAKQYIQEGTYTWNSGMFMFKASIFLAELLKFQPDIYSAAKTAWEEAKKDLDFIRLDLESFGKCRSDSIDYAVMEKTTNALVVPLDAGWNDVGSWSSVWQALPQDENGNVQRGDTLLKDCKNSFVHADHRFVALLGVENIVVVETSDALLIANKDKVQDVKKIVEELKAKKSSLTELHREVHRPWGSYDSIDHGQRYQVKRITVKPGAKLSVQMHHHRAEHWIVVSGTAKVLIGDKEQLISENQSVYIPIGAIHCLENPGKLPLELIEVQSGSYLGEDDIVRLEDRYGRG